MEDDKNCFMFNMEGYEKCFMFNMEGNENYFMFYMKDDENCFMFVAGLGWTLMSQNFYYFIFRRVWVYGCIFFILSSP